MYLLMSEILLCVIILVQLLHVALIHQPKLTFSENAILGRIHDSLPFGQLTLEFGSFSGELSQNKKTAAVMRQSSLYNIMCTQSVLEEVFHSLVGHHALVENVSACLWTLHHLDNLCVCATVRFTFLEGSNRFLCHVS